MSIIDDVLTKHRKRIIDREEAAFRELLRAYEDVERVLRRQIRELEKKVRAAIEKGEQVSPSWYSREQRLRSLIDQVKSEIERFGRRAAPLIAREQQAAIEIAYSQASDILNISIPSRPLNLGSLLNTRVVENAVGFMGDGSPLLNYFEKTLAPAVAERLRTEVIEAAATGKPFAAVARRLQQAGDITRARALATARTEVNRVRRETTRQIYQENSDIITGWEWVANKSSRTCPVCLALDGTIFKLSTFFPQHVNCRCTLIAVIAGVERPKRTLGKDWFEAQSDDVKEKILGKDAFAAFARGEVELKDFIGWKTSPEFGKSVYTKPLSAIINKGN